MPAVSKALAAATLAIPDTSYFAINSDSGEMAGWLLLRPATTEDMLLVPGPPIIVATGFNCRLGVLLVVVIMDPLGVKGGKLLVVASCNWKSAGRPGTVVITCK